jgi:hypothetical protein
MDRVILLHFSGSVGEQIELDGMRPHVLTIAKSHSFNEFAARVRAAMNVEYELMLHGKYDMESNITIYVMLPLGSEDEWQLYKSCARQSGLKGAEVVAEMAPLSGGEITMHEMGVTIEETIADPIAVEQPSQEEGQASELVKINPESLNLTMVRDEFNTDMFDENLDNEQHVEENDELASNESNEENIQPSVDTAPNAPVDRGGEGNEANMPSSVVTLCDVPTSSRIDWGSYYKDEELRALKLKHINLQDYPNHKDISHIGSTVCDSAVVDDEGNPRAREEVIKKGQLFELLNAIKFFF